VIEGKSIRDGCREFAGFDLRVRSRPAATFVNYASDSAKLCETEKKENRQRERERERERENGSFIVAANFPRSRADYFSQRGHKEFTPSSASANTPLPLHPPPSRPVKEGGEFLVRSSYSDDRRD